MFGYFKNRRRQKLLAAEFSNAWRQAIEQNVAAYSLLSTPEQEQIDQAVTIIIAERPFVACGGLTLTDEIKVTIAAQAALLLLGNKGYYFDRVPTVFVYPDNQRVATAHDLGSARLVEDDVLIEGQHLEQGEIRLSWDETLFGSRDPADGENVVLHEFAHHLDSLDGEVGGLPPLSSDLRHDWVRIFDRELADLRTALADRDEIFLHEGAAENRAELFAYSTELFFEQPHDLFEFHADLFTCLLRFYKTDPRTWFE